MKAFLETARSASPYLAVEVLLPGGTLIALAMWAFRHRAQLGARGRRVIARLKRS
jgi:hypothetical protein